MVKRWMWYDWIFCLVRLAGTVSIVSEVVRYQEQFTLPLFVVIGWAIVSFSVPWLCLQLNDKAYLVTEIALSGGLSLYLTSLFPQAYLSIVISAFMIAVNSNKMSYRWTAPVMVLVIPCGFVLVSDQPVIWLPMIHVGMAYMLGFMFHLLIVNHKQHAIIREQHGVLEQYTSQIERITLLEERNRLAKDLHDTMGHAYASIIMGLEALRTECTTGQEGSRIDGMLVLARRSMEEVIGHVRQMEAPQDSMTLIQSLRQLISDFQEHTSASIHIRALGEEYTLIKQVKMTFYRCLQESLTNAVRHGKATKIQITVQFEERQTRMEVQDNGQGTDRLEEGFGLKAMRERADNLQGQVSVYSGLTDGTVVTCTLPRQIELSNEAIRLLIVDDHACHRESLQALLREHPDLQVAGLAEDGERAIERCRELEPHVVLMDMDMPNKDGLAATRMIKQQWPGTRILILTAFPDTNLAVEIMRSGADGYLLKSVEPRELADTIRLVYRGGMVMDQDFANKLVNQIHSSQGTETPLDPITAPATKVPGYDLTPREVEILKLLSKGMRYKSIASALYLSDGTVRNYASALYLKLGVCNREEAIHKALEAGLV
ncbi:hybrid sensor histidine kinase/response regulator transcription factor [Paenibacillus sp. UMB4589-SE434]|uniref:hybrid sensor histidine kinase/response regulator transcription factor n=1 Tax=Paenibacillus sp. UMB4589-SE434 TaxID=3046314 RepID=UPI00254B29FD|nr:hybrid sensor histidine kinase/response regulator transcription factor [Paenibacillus sp. UMB4589-SE434]MDK8181815.1 hybrid sensor histidine kinase/response regulator transcription factor [Paenibacillus sp. UMB4589-SE434]